MSGFFLIFFAPRVGGKKGFTLIEITFSIAILAFVLVSLIGLLSVSFGVDRESKQEAAMALISRKLISSFSLGNLHEDTLYFDAFGNDRGRNGGRIAVKEAYFECHISTISSISPIMEDIQTDYLQIVFSWPAGVPNKNQSKKVIHAKIPRF